MGGWVEGGSKRCFKDCLQQSKTYPVHKVCPRTPPRMTPATLLTEAMTIVASCDLSPHSAKKMRPKALTKTLKIFKHSFPNREDSGFFSAVESECGSTSGREMAERKRREN